MLSRSLLLLPLLLIPLPACAAFSQTQQTVRLAYAQNSATVEFHTADGTTITQANPLCDCMKLSLQGTRLIAHVNTSTFDVPVDKQIKVKTSDGQQTTLTLHFDVPQAINISSPSLIWQRGSKPTPQEFRLQLPKGSPIRALSSADLSGDDFLYQAATITPGREYRITVTPKSTARRCMNRLVIRMDGPDPRYTQRILYLQIR